MKVIRSPRFDRAYRKLSEEVKSVFKKKDKTSYTIQI